MRANEFIKKLGENDLPDMGKDTWVSDDWSQQIGIDAGAGYQRAQGNLPGGVNLSIAADSPGPISAFMPQKGVNIAKGPASVYLGDKGALSGSYNIPLGKDTNLNLSAFGQQKQGLQGVGAQFQRGNWSAGVSKPLQGDSQFNIGYQTTFEEELNELYEPENSFQLNWYPSDYPNEASARAYDRNRGYIDIKFTPVGISKGMDAVEVEFSRNDSYDMTGGGDANRVLGTVLEAFRQYLKNYQPKILIFSSKGASRSKVYQNLINRFASTVGYKQFDISKLSPNTQAAIRMSAGGDVMVLRKIYNES